MGASGASAPRARLQVGCGVLAACPLRVCVCVSVRKAACAQSGPHFLLLVLRENVFWFKCCFEGLAWWKTVFPMHGVPV